MSQSETTSRRTFIKQAVLAGSALAAAQQIGCAGPGRLRSGKVQPAPVPQPKPSYKNLRVAFIGTGGIGGYHLEHAGKLGVSCPCYCDVDTRNFAKAAEQYPDAKPYQDYRRMFDQEARNIDAVMIGTPDHHHYPATILAMRLGKHVYTQKPLTHTPWEARQLAEAARQYKVATQMGNQGHANEGWRLVYEWIRGGALGEIREVHTWTNRPIWPQGIKRPEGEDPVPPHLDWDAWLGPAPHRPYKGPANGKGNGPYHQFNWRGWWDFGAVALGDMACHTMDGLFWALDPGCPSVIEPVAATPVNNETFPTAAVVRWEFPRSWGRSPLVAYWYDGGLMPPYPRELELGRMKETGNLFIGTRASILIQGDYGDSPRIYPEAKMQKIGKPKPLLERSPGHVAEWVMACVGDQPLDYPKSNFLYAGPFSETVLLGNVALRVGRRLEYDGQKMRFTNCPEANQYLTKEYRKGWDV